MSPDGGNMGVRNGNSVRDGKRKTPPPFSLRLSFEERARLERDAGDMPLGAYIRERLFGVGVGVGVPPVLWTVKGWRIAAVRERSFRS